MAQTDGFDSFWTDEELREGDIDAATLVRAARGMIVARRALQASLPIDFLHDPVLDMLLTLFVAAVERQRLTPGDLAAATTIAPGIARRWTAVVAEAGLVKADGDAVTLTRQGGEQVATAIRTVIRSQIALHQVS